MTFLLEGQQQSHLHYQALANQMDASLPHSAAPLPSLLEHFLRQRRLSPHHAFRCDRQMHHLLADIFGASLDTTLATLRYPGR